MLTGFVSTSPQFTSAKTTLSKSLPSHSELHSKNLQPLRSEWVNPDLNSVTDTDLAVWTPRFVLEVRNKDGEHYASSAVRTDSEGTTGMQKFTGCSTSFHWDSGSDRSCKSLLPSSPGASESAFWSSSCSSGSSIFVGFGVSPRIPFKINAHAHVV